MILESFLGKTHKKWNHYIILLIIYIMVIIPFI
jgi:hypothetical protein